MTNWFMSYMPLQASQHSAEIDHMTVLVHWLMLVLFVGWGGFFVFVLFRFRKRANPKASYAGAKGKVAKGLEIGVAIVEIVLLVFYAIPAWATRVAEFPSENEAVVVRVTAKQFEWLSHYPGADGRFGPREVARVAADNPIGLVRTDPDAKDDIVTTNQLNLPVDRPVLVQLTSQDVIHSFGLFEMRVKQDAIPGMEIPVWFIPNKVGQYEIACSQLCGIGHFRMRGFVNIQSAADYQNFLAEEAKLLAQ
jgi:cytochrome c oxidase subunit II